MIRLPTGDRDAPPDAGRSQHPEGRPLPRHVAYGLTLQGFACRPDPAFRAVVPWLRFSPGLTTVGVALGTALASPAVLVAVALATAGCAASTRHPFDLLYHHGVRRVTGTPALPRNRAPRRFACGLASAWSLTAAAAFWAGATAAGAALGGLLVVLGGLVATTHVCAGSWLYRRVVEPGLGRRNAP